MRSTIFSSQFTTEFLIIQQKERKKNNIFEARKKKSSPISVMKIYIEFIFFKNMFGN